MIFDSVFAELAILLFLTAFAGGIATFLRQPLIIAFILVGILAGPSWLDVVQAHEVLELLSEMGIAILLFVVGLKLDPHLIRGSGGPAIVIGALQMGLTFGLGSVLAFLLGFSAIEAAYIGLALSFSSTVIIIKLLSDKREIDALHGRLAIGVLIVQDIAVILALIALSAFSGERGDTGLAAEVGLVIVKGVGLLGALALLMRFGLSQLVSLVARSRELLMISVIAWAMGLAALADALDFSKEVGAFLAGVSLATTPLREVVSARLVTLRDFLLLFFFLSLGANLELAGMRSVLGAAVTLSLLVLLFKPAIIFGTMALLGYRKRTSFLTGTSLGQISEFSLILGALGLSVGHLDETTLSLITIVGIVTITVSTYGILYAHPLYERLSEPLERFERRTGRDEHIVDDGAHTADVVIFGLGRYGSNIARHLEERGLDVLGVDFNPQVVRLWRDRELNVTFGDAEDPEFPYTLPIEDVPVIVSTIPWLESNLMLVSALKHAEYHGEIVATVHSSSEESLLREAGANWILWPFADAAEQASSRLWEAATKHKTRLANMEMS